MDETLANKPSYKPTRNQMIFGLSLVVLPIILGLGYLMFITTLLEEEGFVKRSLAFRFAFSGLCAGNCYIFVAHFQLFLGSPAH